MKGAMKVNDAEAKAVRSSLNAQETQVRLAAERNLLAWVRTGLSMIALGFVVAKFGLFLRELAKATKSEAPSGVAVSNGIGAMFVALGVVTCALAAAQQFRFLGLLRRGDPYPAPRWSLAIVLTIILALLGLGILVYLLGVGL
jgi:putative membrane protein